MNEDRLAKEDRLAREGRPVIESDGGSGSLATIFICVTCRIPESEDRPGRALFEAIRLELQQRPECLVAVAAVECLSVCKRPCTIALSESGKWTYVVGDLNASDHVSEIVDMAMKYRATQDGVVAWRERPVCFRKGVVSRTPPLGFEGKR
jgi:predicted metal-binding protein